MHISQLHVLLALVHCEQHPMEHQCARLLDIDTHCFPYRYFSGKSVVKRHCNGQEYHTLSSDPVASSTRQDKGKLLGQ